MNSPRREKADDVLNVQNIEREAREALVRGDRRAVVNILMRGYGERTYRLCRNLLADVNDAVDASQQVFLLAFEYMDAVESLKYFLPWLRKITTECCADVLKTNGDRSRLLFVVGNQPPDDADLRPSGEEVLTSQWLISEVEVCMDELPAHHRLMLTLRFVEELTCVEMAELLEMSVSIVKSRVKVAMVAMRRSLLARGIRP